jgi:hypothetical protein
MKTVKKLVKLIGITIGSFFACVMLYVWACLAWIAFRPLPHIPHYGVQYSLKDAGPIGSQYLDFYGSNPLDCGWRLTSSGAVVQLNAEQESSVKARRANAALRLAQKLHFAANPDPYDHAYPVAAISSNDHALIFQGDTLWLWQNGRFVEALPRPVNSFYNKARGYSWPIFDERFFKINAHNVVIGNGRIATAPASSGGFSSPHGRFMPLVWRPGYKRPEDLNSRIDPASGWYLDQAVDINGHKQILCVARRTDEDGAENYQQTQAHWVVLTPV